MIDWIVRKLLKNLGTVAGGMIQRSGQPGWARLRLHYLLYPFKSVINLSWSDKDPDDGMEWKFCRNRKIDYYRFSFGSGGPWKLEDEALRVVELIDKVPKPVWVHCEGGKDRTGGILIRWMTRHSYSLMDIEEQLELYGIPAKDWLDWAYKEVKHV